MLTDSVPTLTARLADLERRVRALESALSKLNTVPVPETMETVEGPNK